MEQKFQKNDFRPPVDMTKKHRFDIHRIKEGLFKRPPKKRLAIVGGTSFSILTLGIVGVTFFGPKPPAPNPEPTVTSNYKPPEPTTKPSPLTGVEVSPELAARAVTGVMIENSVDARPQSGLSEAGVVFEAIAEGGITRFLALFQEAQPGSIGPIRSARPYYVRWAAGYDAAYAHSGGSGEALSLIRELGIKDMDHGVYGNRFFDRVSNRYAPHNVYTSMARLDELRKEKGFNESSFESQARLKDDPKTKSKDESKITTGTPAKSISFTISSPLYNTAYTYDAENSVYKRTMAGTPHTDEKSGAQISPKVVVALYMTYGIHPNGTHSVYGNVGTGKALVFHQGIVQEALWEKANDKASLLLKLPDGKPLALTAGQTWFTAIPEGKVTYQP